MADIRQQIKRREKIRAERVNHPAHYGSAEDPYEHQKVVRAWGLNYWLGCSTKYMCRAGKKPGVPALEDLRKAAKYLALEIEHQEREQALDKIGLRRLGLAIRTIK